MPDFSCCGFLQGLGAIVGAAEAPQLPNAGPHLHRDVGPAKKGRETEEFLRNAHADIPMVVEAMRQYWMPTRYARAG